MNTKKNKGKSKSNKAPNPNPPQKVEDPDKDVEKAENVSVGEIDSALRSDIRVPEIISEVGTPAVEVKEKEDDSPKKPKRNRGKKKKHDKDEDDNPDEKPKECVEVIEIVEIETQETPIEESMAPSARKKKSKNKKAIDPDSKSTEKKEKENVETEKKLAEQIVVDIKGEIAPQDVTEQEIKQSKKKNKKKKRNDSERSEKAEELSCTAAFQMLLKEDKTEIKTAENKPSDDTKSVSDIVTKFSKDVKKDTKKENSELESILPTEDIKEEPLDAPQTSTTNESGNKNKMKNKKDKKEPQSEKKVEDDDSFDMPEIVLITDITTETKKPVEVQEAVKEDKSSEILSTEKTFEEDLKPKAKIAKPVEKKRKGKEVGLVQDCPEAFHEKEQPTFELSKEEKRSLIICELQEVQTDVTGIKLDLTEQKSKQEVLPEIKAEKVESGTETKTTEKIDVPEINKNKNRKKSPKPGQQEKEPVSTSEAEQKLETFKEKYTQIQPKITTKSPVRPPIIEVKSQDALITEAFEELIRIPESDKSKKRKKSPKPNIAEQKTNIEFQAIKEMTVPSKEEIKGSSQKESKIERETIPLPAPIVETLKEVESKETSPKTEEIKKELLLGQTDEKDDFKIQEAKSKKKRKKSPKLPHEPEAAHKTKETVTAAKATTEKEENKTEKAAPEKSEESGNDKTETIYDMPLAEEIEIRSLNADESEGSTCGYTPDMIQHPRATSQDLIDDNNNMMIQEISVEEVKLQIPTDTLDTPFIQGSGETPLTTPECAFVGVQISEITVPDAKSQSEKTDIKSKMMEVNQDMEELRMSIERSLAELTSIEKSEEEVEKKFQEKTVHTPVEPKSPEVKTGMPSELIFKSQSDKIETNTSKANKTKENVPPPKSDDTPVAVDTIIAPALSFEQDSQSKNSKTSASKKMFPEQSSAIDMSKLVEKPTETIMPPVAPARKDKSMSRERDMKTVPVKPSEDIIKPTEVGPEVTTTPPHATDTTVPPAVPARKDNKNKGKNKKKGKQDTTQAATQSESTSSTVESKESAQETTKKEEKSQQKPDTKQDKGKQHSDIPSSENKTPPDFKPIENFEDAMTSSSDDINKTFEMIATDAAESQFREASHLNPEIKIVAPVEDSKPDKKDEKVNPVSPPKNLLGHPDIPVPSNRTDYKKEKNKTPNTILAKVKIKDAVQIEGKKQTKDTQTDNIRKFMKNKSIDESFSSVTNENDEFVYKYSFRKVFLQSACHVCKKDLKQTRIPCTFCNLIFYCNTKHKDEDWNKHQGFCFAVSTIVHLKEQKHIYADSKNITGQDYRLLRMQMIVSCEKVLKRKLTPFEQEALLYPRLCADPKCREWRQSKLTDCDGCGQISYCSEHPDHFPKSHQRWCKSYSLYQKLVCYQQTRGRLEPNLHGKIMTEPLQVSEKMNEVLAAMYEEKIDMNDIQYATLTQIATAPLTAAYCLQAYAKLANHTNGACKKTTCTIHIVGGELQFEADALNKWEVFFLHLRPDLQEVRVVMIGRDLNPSNLPLELLGKVKLCENCRAIKRRVIFSFQDKTTYHDYWASDAFIAPDIVCAFNPSIKRSSMYNGKDPWPKTINCVLKLKVPFLVTAYTMIELQKDLARIKDCSDVDHKLIIEPKFNSFASVRPDRNFISDDEMPLLFKNYCYSLVAGAN